MKKTTSPLLIALLLLAQGGLFFQPALAQTEDRRADRSRLVIMTLNAQFLWDGVLPEEGGPSVTFPWKFSQFLAEEHMEAVAEVILRDNPDIINLVEVESIEALNRFNQAFLQGQGYTAHLIKGRDTVTGQDVALLTRIDPDEAIARDDSRHDCSRPRPPGTRTCGVSKNYFVTFTLDDAKIALIGLHFVSLRRTSNDIQREAQAAVISDRAIELKEEGFDLVVLGDFNDFDGDADSRDVNNNMPNTVVLSTIKEMDPNDDLDDLTNMASFVPQANRFTSLFGGGNAIDHILLSPALADRVTEVEYPHDAQITEATDHFPVVVRLAMGTAPDPLSPAALQIVSLLPNPAGNENLNERVTVRNAGQQPVNLDGWMLRDRVRTTWSLDGEGTLQPGQEKTIQRNNRQMALNNSGDTIELLDPAGQVVQTVSYTSTREGVVVEVDAN